MIYNKDSIGNRLQTYGFEVLKVTFFNNKGAYTSSSSFYIENLINGMHTGMYLLEKKICTAKKNMSNTTDINIESI